jgi:hypothetical protein
MVIQNVCWSSARTMSRTCCECYLYFCSLVREVPSIISVAFVSSHSHPSENSQYLDKKISHAHICSKDTTEEIKSD